MVGLLLLADRCLNVAGQRLAIAQDGANQVSSSKPIPGWEVTPESEAALQKGLAWLARNQGTEGNWESEDLGLVGLGGLSFLAAGHLPQRGRYGDTVDRAFKYVLKSQTFGASQFR